MSFITKRDLILLPLCLLITMSPARYLVAQDQPVVPCGDMEKALGILGQSGESLKAFKFLDEEKPHRKVQIVYASAERGSWTIFNRDVKENPAVLCLVGVGTDWSEANIPHLEAQGWYVAYQE